MKTEQLVDEILLANARYELRKKEEPYTAGAVQGVYVREVASKACDAGQKRLNAEMNNQEIENIPDKSAYTNTL